jgi:hypothetical protein
MFKSPEKNDHYTTDSNNRKKNKKKYLKFAFYIPELSLKKDEAFLFESG